MTALVAELNKAEKAGEIQFSSAPGTPREFVELLFTSIGGIKKKATSGADFRKQVRQLTEIFLDTLQCCEVGPIQGMTRFVPVLIP